MISIVKIEEIPKVEDIIDTPVDNLIHLYKTCRALEELCRKEQGIGISAVQAGIPWKTFIILEPPYETNPIYYINCEYEPLVEDKHESLEGCLSLRNDKELRRFLVDRYNTILVKGQKLVTRGGQPKLEKVDIVLDKVTQGNVFQHEIDHHRGILISDFGKEVEVSPYGFKS